MRQHRRGKYLTVMAYSKKNFFVIYLKILHISNLECLRETLENGKMILFFYFLQYPR